MGSAAGGAANTVGAPSTADRATNPNAADPANRATAPNPPSPPHHVTTPSPGRDPAGHATTPSQPTPGRDPAALLFGALADPTRRQVVQLLGTRPLRAGELAAATGMSGPAMSRHLRVLLRAGLVVDERLGSDARARVFRLRPESLVALQAWLDQLQANWDEQLAAFKRYVDGRPAG